MNLQAIAEIPISVRRWKSYPAYKKSGTEWLDTIPAHWEAKRIKRLCFVKRGASPRPIEDPIYFDDEGEYAWVRISDVTASTKYLETTEQRLSEIGKSKSVPLEPGELFLSIAATVGKPIITRIKCCIHDGFVYFVGLKENREYLFYVFSSGELYKGIGKTGTQLNLNTDTIGDIRIPVPTSREQEIIAAFLDQETARIDSLVKKKERVIELLQEKRAALITSAVTKGVDPNVAMKDSGIEWLGQIPAHWQIKKGRHLGRLLSSPNLDVFHIDDEGPIPFMKVDDLNRLGSSLHLEHSTERMRPLGKSPQLFESEIILFPKRGAAIFTNKVRIVKGPVLFDSNLMGWQLLDTVYIKYLAYALLARGLSDLADISSVPQINNKHVYPSSFPLPPKGEQGMIADFLDAEVAKIDSVIMKIREGIEKLKEYRSALISAAVTGKIDVREDVAA